MLILKIILFPLYIALTAVIVASNWLVWDLFSSPLKRERWRMLRKANQTAYWQSIAIEEVRLRRKEEYRFKKRHRDMKTHYERRIKRLERENSRLRSR